MKHDAHSSVGLGVGGEDADLFAHLVESDPHWRGRVGVAVHLGKNKPVGIPTSQSLDGSGMRTAVSLHFKVDGILFLLKMDGVLLGGARSFCGPFS